MKHAGKEALDTLEELLEKIRRHEGLIERKRGVFYMKSIAFLHFHEDPAGLFADVHAREGWKRFPVSNKGEQRTFLSYLASLKSNDVNPSR